MGSVFAQETRLDRANVQPMILLRSVCIDVLKQNKLVANGLALVWVCGQHLAQEAQDVVIPPKRTNFETCTRFRADCSCYEPPSTPYNTWPKIFLGRIGGKIQNYHALLAMASILIWTLTVGVDMKKSPLAYCSPDYIVL